MDPDRPANHIWWDQNVKFYRNLLSDASSGAESTTVAQ